MLNSLFNQTHNNFNQVNATLLFTCCRNDNKYFPLESRSNECRENIFYCYRNAWSVITVSEQCFDHMYFIL